tara:strand:+ start:3372 stop:3788 length:417 start_codon:yes stop_codon:yes gene_type:complete
MAGPYRPPTTAGYRRERTYYNPLDVNRDGKVNLKDLKAAKDKVVNKLDQDGDGDFDLQDLHAVADKLINRKKTCSKCGKKLKKKSKYQTGVCVECYRNPSDEERCIAVTSSGNRCQRRISDKSHKGYCGIHIRKYEAQ